MSYGKYMAKYGWNPPIMRQQQEEPEDDVIVCPECGKRFRRTNKSRVYCCYECYNAFTTREAQRRYRERKAMESKARIYGYQAHSGPRNNVDARYRGKMRQKQNIAAQAASSRHKEKGGTK